ncbi:hypothetical protein [Draconibacterium orientale]|uniref:hypothetical protein n=1 Tax=Draconibacterium orientale TaxID=1168034 RepID=UPI0009432787|nr:hypothetical protein [Draconibacterium orientale]
MKNDLFWEIPSSLNLEDILKKRPPEFKYKIDKFYYILDYLARGMDVEDLDNNEGFINLNAKRLQEAVHDYKDYLDYLLKRGIISTDMIYIVGKKSKGYRINSNKEHKVSVQRIPITSWPMQKKKRKEQEDLVAENNKTVKGYGHLTKWFNDKLQIDETGAKAKIEEVFPEPSGPIRGKLKGRPSDWNKRYKAIYSIEKFAKGDFYYSVDDNVGRFHSNLTNIKKELRHYITFDGQRLVNVDIKNSQPLFSQLLLSKNFYENESEPSIFNFPHSFKLISPSSNSPSFTIMVVKMLQKLNNEDIGKYVSMVNSGQFYNQMSDLLFPNQAFEKKKVKMMFFKVLFSSNYVLGQPSAKDKKKFAESFPDVYQIFKLIKRKNHTALAHILQRIESEVILRKVVSRIASEKPNLPIFTIHDSVATTVGDEKYVKNVMKEEIKSFTKLNAKFGLEYWD